MEFSFAQQIHQNLQTRFVSQQLKDLNQVSFELFLAPILRQLSGMPAAVRERRVLAVDVTSVEGKRQFLRGRALPNGRVEPVGGASSHLVAGLAASDLLIDIPAETSRLTKGDTVETLIL